MAKDEKHEDTLMQEILRLEAEKEALLQEFTNGLEGTNSEYSPEDLKEKFRKLLPFAYETLLHLVTQGESEAVRLSASKYIFNIGLGQVKITDANEPQVNSIIRELLANSD